MDEDDIYNDLPVYDHHENLEKLENDNRSLRNQVSSLNEEVEKLRAENSDLSKKCTTLSKNISSVLKTARCEIKRKDNRITELNKEIATLRSKLNLRKNKIQEVRSPRKGNFPRHRDERSSWDSRRRNSRSSSRFHESRPLRRTRQEDDEEYPRKIRRDSSSRRTEGKKTSEKNEALSDSLNQSNETKRHSVSHSPDPKIQNVISKTTLQSESVSTAIHKLNLENEISSVVPASKPRVPNIEMKTLYSQRMFNKIYNVDSPKPALSNFESSFVTPVESVTVAAVGSSVSKVDDSNITETKESSVQNFAPEDNVQNNKLKSSSTKKKKINDLVSDPNNSEITLPIIPKDNQLNPSGIHNDELKISTKSANTETIPIQSACASTPSIEKPCDTQIVNKLNKCHPNLPKTIIPEPTLKSTIALKKSGLLPKKSTESNNFSSIELDIKESVVSTLNVERVARNVKVADLESIISNLNKINSSKASKNLTSSENNVSSEHNIKDIEGNKSDSSKITIQSANDNKSSEKHCSLSLGLKIFNRTSKATFNPISSQWSETCKKIVGNDLVSKSKNTEEKPPSQNSPKSEDSKGSHKDLMEELFGSPLKWAENSTDETPPKLCPPSSAFEDSCSAQIENVKFKNLNTTESFTSTKTVKEVIISNSGENNVTEMKIESHISFKKSKENRPFEQISENIQNPSIALCLENTNEACDVPTFTGTSISDSLKAKNSSPVFGPKYQDSILGQFDDTTQLISALAKEHSKISPIHTPIKKAETSDSVSPTQSLVKDKEGNSDQINATPNKPFAFPSLIKKPEKKTILLEEPINILNPRRRAREVKTTTKSENSKIKSENSKGSESKKNNEQTKEILSDSNSKVNGECTKESKPSSNITNLKGAHKNVIEDSKNAEEKLSSSTQNNKNSPREYDRNRGTEARTWRSSSDYKLYYDEKGRKKAPFTTISTRTSFSPSRNEDSPLEPHYASTRDDFKKPSSYSTSHRRGNCFFRESSVERKILKDNRHRIIKSSGGIYKRRYDYSSSSRSRYRRSSRSTSPPNDKPPESRNKTPNSMDEPSSTPKERPFHHQSSSRRSSENCIPSDHNTSKSQNKTQMSTDKPSSNLKDQPSYRQSSSCRSSEDFTSSLTPRDRSSPYQRKTTDKPSSVPNDKPPYRQSGSHRSSENFTSPDNKPPYRPSSSRRSTENIASPDDKLRQPPQTRTLKSMDKPSIIQNEKPSYRPSSRTSEDVKSPKDKAPLSKNTYHRSRENFGTANSKFSQAENLSSPKDTSTQKKNCSSPNNSSLNQTVLKSDNPPPMRIVRASKKIDWSVSTSEVISAQPRENLPGKSESLMKWVLQPIEFTSGSTPSYSKQSEENNMSVSNKIVPPQTIRSPEVPIPCNKEITPQKTPVIIKRKRPIKFGVSEMSTQFCKTLKES